MNLANFFGQLAEKQSQPISTTKQHQHVVHFPHPPPSYPRGRRELELVVAFSNWAKMVSSPFGRICGLVYTISYT